MGGTDKLLQPVDGRPLLRDRVAAARTTGEPVIVALPPRAEAPGRWRALEASGALPVEVAEASSGMAASLRAGLAALPEGAKGVLVLLADMPDISTGDMLSLITRFDGAQILRGATARGEPGHPVLFPASDFALLTGLSGDQGAREALKAESARVRLVPLPGAHALTDLDTPEDWAQWRAGRD